MHDVSTAPNQLVLYFGEPVRYATTSVRRRMKVPGDGSVPCVMAESWNSAKKFLGLDFAFSSDAGSQLLDRWPPSAE